MKPMFPAVSSASSGDDRHNHVEPTNRSGGPSTRNRKSIPPKNRGGMGQHGQRRTQGSISGRAKPNAGNPASRGAEPGSFRPQANNPNHGGGVALRTEHRNVKRQFGTYGKSGVVNDYSHSNPQAGAGNVSGRMAKRVSGHFTNKTKKGGGGGFGSLPVTEEI